MKGCSGRRRHLRGHARGHWVLMPVAVLASMAIWWMQPPRGAQTAVLGAPASADLVAQLSAWPPAGVGPAASAVPVLDHAVVVSKQLADEPDMTGASIAAYGP